MCNMEGSILKGKKKISLMGVKLTRVTVDEWALNPS
jgi:hypothetical protein